MPGARMPNSMSFPSPTLKFRAKYGDGGVKLYSKLDVAVLVQAR
jgi:hypothetical protein